MSGQTGPIQNTVVCATFQFFRLVCPRFLPTTILIYNILEQRDNSSNCRKNGPRPLKIGPNGPKMAQNVGTDRTNSKHFGLCHFSNFSIGLPKVFANHINHILEQRFSSTNCRKNGPRPLKTAVVVVQLVFTFETTRHVPRLLGPNFLKIERAMC